MAIVIPTCDLNPPLDQQVDVIRKLLAHHEVELERAQIIIKREGPIVQSLRGTLAALTDASNPVKAEMDVPLHQFNGTPLFSMPPRLPEFKNGTVIAGIQAILERAHDYRHADEIVRAIYGVHLTPVEFQAAKRTAVSELIRGIDKGLFVRDKTRTNTFGRVGFLQTSDGGAKGSKQE